MLGDLTPAGWLLIAAVLIAWGLTALSFYMGDRS